MQANDQNKERMCMLFTIQRSLAEVAKLQYLSICGINNKY